MATYRVKYTSNAGNYTAAYNCKDLQIYGAARVSIYTEDICVSSTAFTSTDFNEDKKYINPTYGTPSICIGATEWAVWRGYRAYEHGAKRSILNTIFACNAKYKREKIANHLGNVIATITDRKKQVDNNANNQADFYEPRIVSVAVPIKKIVYFFKKNTTNSKSGYAFGSVMKERQYTITGYKYAYNGKEKENETFEDCIVFEARIFDARIGRFLSTDPRKMEYAWQSTYVYFKNCPISILDFLGKGGPKDPAGGGSDSILVLAPAAEKKLSEVNTAAWYTSKNTSKNDDLFVKENLLLPKIDNKWLRESLPKGSQVEADYIIDYTSGSKYLVYPDNYQLAMMEGGIRVSDYLFLLRSLDFPEFNNKIPYSITGNFILNNHFIFNGFYPNIYNCAGLATGTFYYIPNAVVLKIYLKDKIVDQNEANYILVLWEFIGENYIVDFGLRVQLPGDGPDYHVVGVYLENDVLPALVYSNNGLRSAHGAQTLFESKPKYSLATKNEECEELNYLNGHPVYFNPRNLIETFYYIKR